jgi:phosphatidylglycerophosphate synthase
MTACRTACDHLMRNTLRFSPRVWPLALTTVRLLLAPLALILASRSVPGWIWVTILVTAFLSDIFDGIVARRLGVATAGLRRYDSATDACFYLAMLWAAWRLHPQALRDHAWGIGAVIALELTRDTVDFVKFRREAAYHMWSSKLWGVANFLCFFALLGFGATWGLPLAIVVGIYSQTEGLIASFVLTRWTHDVPTVFHAWRWKNLQAPGLCR